MFQGSESLEKLAHFRHVQGSGGVFNGSTHQDYTDYFEVLPAAALERALFLEADRLRAPTLTEENLRNQVDVVKEEIRLNVLNRPYGGFPWILLPPVLYDTFPNAHNGYGDFAELEQASLDDAAAFFDTYYAPGNAQVTVAGDLDVDETACSRWSRSTSATSRPGPRPSRPSFAEPPPGARAPRRPCPTRTPRCPRSPSATGCPTRARTSTATSATRCSARSSATARPPACSVGWCTCDGLVTDVSASAGLMGAARRARPRHVHDHRGAPAVGGPRPRAGRGRRGARQARRRGPGRGRAGPPGRPLVRRRCTTKNDRVMYRMLGLGARELLYGRAELAAELPGRGSPPSLPSRSRAAAAALRGQRACGADRRTARGPRAHRGAGVTVTVANPDTSHRRGDRPHRGRPAAAARRSGPPARCRCRTSSDVTLATGLRVLAARSPGVPMVELRLRVPFAGDDARAPGACAELLAATLLTGTATRDRVAIDDELAARRRGPRCRRRSRTAPDRRVRARRRAADDPGRARRRAHRRRAPRRRGRPRARAGSSSGSRWPARSRARSPARRCSASGSAPTRSRGRCRRAADVAAVEPRTVRALHAAVAGAAAASILTLVGDLDPARRGRRTSRQRLAGWTASTARPAS